jgi:O-antigen/teichoic acid export membrane protein
MEKKPKTHNILKLIIGKIPALRKLLKDEVGLIYTTIGGLGANVLGAALWLILASILTVDNYGLANYYIALATLVSGIGIIGLNTTVTTFLAKGDEKILFEGNSLALISGIIVSIILSLFEWTAGLLSITTVFFTMTLAETLGKKTYKEYAFIQIGQKIAQLGLSLLLYFQLGIAGVILGYVIGSLIFSYKYLFTLRKFTTNLSSIKTKRNFALHTYGYSLVGLTLSNNIDKILVGPLFGYYTLGLYQLAFQFLMFLGLIPTSLQQYLLPEEASGKNKKQLKIAGFLLSIAACIAIFFLSAYLIPKFFPNFTNATLLVSIMSIAIIPSTAAAILTATLLANEKSKTVFTAGLIYIIALISFLISLGYIMGVLGLAVAIIAAKTLQATYLVFKRNTTPTPKPPTNSPIPSPLTLDPKLTPTNASNPQTI